MLDYNQETGVFTWRISPRHRETVIRPGDVAGKTTERGYRKICIDGRNHFSHRLAWFYVHGEWPADQMDHRDLDKANNAIANLRPATQQQNQWNTKAKRTSLTGIKGVRLRDGKFDVRIMRNGRRVVLGRFEDINAARDAYLQAAAELHGEFVRPTTGGSMNMQVTQ